MFKNMVIKSVTLMVCMWYFLCITGFDVHTCRNAHKTFVVSMLADTENCTVIHPVDHCGDEDSCHSKPASIKPGMTLTAATCCSDEIQNMESAYALVKDSMRKMDNILSLHVLHQIPSAMGILSCMDPEKEAMPEYEGQPFFHEEDILSYYSIFRI